MLAVSAFFTLILSSIHAQPLGTAKAIPGADTNGIKNKFLDIVYATRSPSEKLDLYLPAAGQGPFPVIVFIHGGAFVTGDKADDQVNPALAGVKRGYAVVSLNYRLSGEAKFPAAIQDIKAAIRFIRANAAKYNLNAGKIAGFGNSAGGYFASMIGTTGNLTIFDDPSLGNPDQSSKVIAVVDLYGPIIFDNMDEQFRQTGKGQADHGNANSPESRYLGQQVSTSPELVRRASPATYISADSPPFFIEAGVKDQIVPAQQSIDFYTALAKIKGKEEMELILLPDVYHGGHEFETPDNLAKIYAFLDKYLKSNQPANPASHKVPSSN